MYEIEPYIQRPNDFHQCFEYVTHDTRCTQTAIQGEYFCPRHRISPSPILLYPDGGFSLPALTDRDTILQVASQIAQRLAYNAIDAKRAGKILYACQLANSALDGKLRDQNLARQLAQSASPRTENAVTLSEAKNPCISEATDTQLHPNIALEAATATAGLESPHDHRSTSRRPASRALHLHQRALPRLHQPPYAPRDGRGFERGEG